MDIRDTNYTNLQKEAQERYLRTVRKYKVERNIGAFVAAVILSCIIYFRFYFEINPMVLLVSCAIFIVTLVITIDRTKKIYKEKDNYKFMVNSIRTKLEKQNIFIPLNEGDYTKFDGIGSKISKQHIVYGVIIIAFIVCLYGVSDSYIHTFTPEKWKENEWQRKYMYDDLERQQIYDGTLGGIQTAYGSQNEKYNMYYYSRDEIRNIFFDEKYKEIKIDIYVDYEYYKSLDYDDYFLFEDSNGIKHFLVAAFKGEETDKVFIREQ